MKQLTLSDVIKRIKGRNPGKFRIKDLYTPKEWNNFTKGSRIKVGTELRKVVGTIKSIYFVGKNSANSCTYIKI